jgi:hypothetical protein
MPIIGISGRKQSGKSTASNFIVSLYMAQLGLSNKVYLNDEGKIIVSDLLGDENYAGEFDPTNSDNIQNDYHLEKVFTQLNPFVRVYSFADALKKEICINILGLSYNQCYGSDEDKNSPTHLKWEDMPDYNISFGTGNMTAREVMEYVGTNIFRKMYEKVWTQRTLNKIEIDKSAMSIISDCRFPNEIDSIKNKNGQIIRLTRNPFNSTSSAEVALDKDNFDYNNFDHIIDNSECSLYDQSIKLQKTLQEILKL